jgi:hypothetical protein
MDKAILASNCSYKAHHFKKRFPYGLIIHHKKFLLSFADSTT